MPRLAKLVIAGAIVGAGLSVILLVRRYGVHDIGSSWVLGLLSAFILASWLWPIVMYHGSSSRADHLDEGFFLVLVLVLPPTGVLLAFVIATALAQALRRRSLVKSIFNLAQILLSVSAGVAAVHLLVAPARPLTIGHLVAGVLGTVVYFLVNSIEVAAILAATGSERLHKTLLDGIDIRARLFAAAVSLGIVSALAISAFSGVSNAVMATLFVGVLFFVFRQTLAGHYQARHDRTRLLGLFDATLDVHRTMGYDEVTSALSRKASGLLRSPEAFVLGEEPPLETMSTRMNVKGDDRWLVVSGRSRSEPFDGADRALLDALGAVGSGALENASLYEEGRRQQEQLVAITSSLAEGVCAFDATGALTFLNPAAEALLGWAEADVIADGRQLIDDELNFLIDPAFRSMRSHVTIHSERGVFRNRSGNQFPVEITCSPIRSGSQIEGAVVAFRDISERIRYEEQLAYHAFHDDLTTLPNRRVFLDRLQHALARSMRTGAVHAVLFADIDRFKLANDSLGHRAGDQLLVVIAERLMSLVREGDTLARFGGDEFTLLLEEVDGLQAAEAVASAMLELVRTPVALEEGRTVMASVSIGIALATAGASPDDVLHDADVAMYQAKRRGADHYEVFDAAAMSARSAEWVDLEHELREALDGPQLVVHYQPVFATESLAISGAEALVRWEHPTRGLLAPAHFISLAEETGLILPVGRLVLEQACRQTKQWCDEFSLPFNIAVNLSARQFQSNSLVEDIGAILERTGLEPVRLSLEITESLALHDVERSITTMTELKMLGIRLAIDDFGTGYSSLNYLKRFPVDVVKLDQSFVHDLGVSAVDTAIVAAVIDLARTVGMTAIAEGVETESQLNRLESLGCPFVQGYLLARPMPSAQLTELLRNGLGTTASGRLRVVS